MSAVQLVGYLPPPLYSWTVPPTGPSLLSTNSPVPLGIAGQYGSETTGTVSMTDGDTPDEKIVDVRFVARSPGWGMPGFNQMLYNLVGPHYPIASISGTLLLQVQTTNPAAFLIETDVDGWSMGYQTLSYSVDVMDDGITDLSAWLNGPSASDTQEAKVRGEPIPSGLPIRIAFNLYTNGDIACTSLELGLRIRIAPALAASVTPFGFSCPIAGTQPVLTAGTNLPQLGQTCTFLVTSLPTTSSHAVLGALSVEAGSLGGVPLPIDLTPIGMPGCSQYIDPILTMLYGTVATNGTATWPLYIPDEPWVLGLPFYAQCLIDAPGENPLGLVTTNALACVAGL